MSLFGFLKSRGTAPVARERLQILLAHERVALGPRDLVAILRDELLATIARHIEFDPDKLSVKMERSELRLDAGDRRGDSPRQDRRGGSGPRPSGPVVSRLRPSPSGGAVRERLLRRSTRRCVSTPMWSTLTADRAEVGKRRSRRTARA